MAKERSWTIAAPAGRLAFEAMLWLPIGLLLLLSHGGGAKALAIAAGVASFAVGFVVSQLRPPWRLLGMLLVMLLLVAATVAIDWREAAIGAWLAAIAWRGRYVRATSSHYALGFGFAAVGTLVATNLDEATGYRIPFAVLAVAWLAGTMISYNRQLVQEAGLHGPIVTRAVRRDSRKYTLAFLAVVLALFGATLYYALQWLRPPRVHLNVGGGGDSYEPPAQMPQPELPPIGDDYKPNPIWDWVGYIVGGLAALAILYVLYSLWRRRTWSWQSLKGALMKLFLRDRKEEALPYVEERRSLPKEKPRFGGLFRRQPREPDWNELDSAAKVRRLYAEAVAAGAEAGYPHRAHHTPSEALSGLSGWRETRQAESRRKAEKRAAYWVWFAGVREALRRLYEQARYSPHEVREQDVAELVKRHPDREKL